MVNALLQEPQNHVVFVLDQSTSMRSHAEALVKLFDNEVAFLAQHSKELNQETRVSVYVFGSQGTAKCVIYDMDVLRLPSIKELYKPYGNTALCDATVLAVEDLQFTKHKYGQHSYWMLVFTDGFENDSSQVNRNKLPKIMASMPEEWTVSIFVPDQISKKYAIDRGFPRDNIAIWDTSSVRGVEEMGKTVRAASETFFDMRSKGGTGTKSLFNFTTVSTDAVKRNLTPIPHNMYLVVKYTTNNKQPIWIRDLVNQYLGFGEEYKRGRGYYELVKNEHVQPTKGVIIEQNGTFYGGSARDLLGLPDETVKVTPDYKAGYKIFVQSGSHNRNIIPGQRVLYLTGNSISSYFR